MPLSPTLAAFGPEGLGQPEIRIIADDSTRSLVIRALPRDYRQIREASAKLDTLPLQILIEVTIAEVTLWNELRYGMEWFFRSGDFRATSPRIVKATSLRASQASPPCSRVLTRA